MQGLHKHHGALEQKEKSMSAQEAKTQHLHMDTEEQVNALSDFIHVLAGIFVSVVLHTSCVNAKRIVYQLSADQQIALLDLLWDFLRVCCSREITGKVEFIGVYLDSEKKEFVVTLQYPDTYSDITVSSEGIDWSGFYDDEVAKIHCVPMLPKELFLAGLLGMQARLDFSK